MASPTLQTRLSPRGRRSGEPPRDSRAAAIRSIGLSSSSAGSACSVPPGGGLTADLLDVAQHQLGCCGGSTARARIPAPVPEPAPVAAGLKVQTARSMAVLSLRRSERRRRACGWIHELTYACDRSLKSGPEPRRPGGLARRLGQGGSGLVGIRKVTSRRSQWAFNGPLGARPSTTMGEPFSMAFGVVSRS